jgi:hypothetical protein
MVHINNIKTLKSIYCPYFHSVIKMEYFWGKSSTSGNIFILQKKIIRIMVGAQPRTSFKQLDTIAVPCQCKRSLNNFIIYNQKKISNKFIYTQY